MKALRDSGFILFIGLSPLVCQYSKTKIDSTSFARQIKNKILLKHQIPLTQQRLKKYSVKDISDQEEDYISMKDVQDAIQQSKAQQKLSEKQKIQLQMIKKMMQNELNISSIYVKKTIAISGLHVLGGLFSPNIFFASICSYFILYQARFLQQLFEIKNGTRTQNSLTFDKLNNLYLFGCGIMLGLVGTRVGIQKLSKRAMK